MVQTWRNIFLISQNQVDILKGLIWENDLQCWFWPILNSGLAVTELDDAIMIDQKRVFFLIVFSRFFANAWISLALNSFSLGFGKRLSF